MTEATHRTYLTQEAGLTAMLHRMERLPSYRPARFQPGGAALTQAAEYLADHREATRELATEGDS